MILVMDQGQIVERGTHEELLTRGGLYKEIHDLQLVDHARFSEEMEELQELESSEADERHTLS
jgi:ABC-type antimicrobial peptide transport system ATPase subunit